MLITATCRPFVLTPKGHLSVLAIKVFLETAYPVQVMRNSLRIIITNVFFYIGLFGFIDINNLMFYIDECTSSSHNCDTSLATCNNTLGSFACTCILGYTGNGIMCSGDA